MPIYMTQRNLPSLPHGLSREFLQEELIFLLDEAGLEPILHCEAVTTDSFYIKFKDERLRSLRVGDHGGKKKYRYKWNLRLDMHKFEKTVKKGAVRYFYPIDQLPQLILHMQRYLRKCQQSDNKETTNAKL